MVHGEGGQVGHEEEVVEQLDRAGLVVVLERREIWVPLFDGRVIIVREDVVGELRRRFSGRGVRGGLSGA